MSFNGYIEEPVYDSDGSVAYMQYTIDWRMENE